MLASDGRRRYGRRVGCRSQGRPPWRCSRHRDVMTTSRMLRACVRVYGVLLRGVPHLVRMQIIHVWTHLFCCAFVCFPRTCGGVYIFIYYMGVMGWIGPTRKLCFIWSTLVVPHLLTIHLWRLYNTEKHSGISTAFDTRVFHPFHFLIQMTTAL